MSKKIVFEGKIDGEYVQLYFDEKKSKYFFMQEIKKSDIKEAIKYVVKHNAGKPDHRKLDIQTKLLNNRPTDFMVGQTSESVVRECIQKNRASQVTRSQIKDMPRRADMTHSFVNKNHGHVGCANKKKDNIGKKIAAMALVGAMFVSGVALTINQLASEQSIPDVDVPGYEIMESTPEREENVITPEKLPQDERKIELEDVELNLKSNGSLTSDSARDLSNGIVNEIDELYEHAGWDTPQVIESETLTSLFYVENTLKPEDSTDGYVGIGQMSKIAVEAAVTRANKLYKRADANGSLKNVDNYIIDNICSKGNENLDEQVNRLWEKSKTDAKICGSLTGLYLADLSDRYEKSVGGNKASIIIMYNAGEGNFQSYQRLGIITLSSDKTGMKIDLGNVDKLDTPAKHKKWNEAVNYVIKVLEGSKRLKENPKADANEVCEQTRLDVGKNDNNLSKPNTNQYKYAPEGVQFNINELENVTQPGS